MVTKRTPRAELLRRFVLDMVRLEGAMRRHTESLTAPHDQTPARWKVLTAAGCDVRTVPQIARRMGLTRQAVQRVANELVEDGLAVFEDNPDHRGSPLLTLTREGRRTDDAISDAHARWSNRVARHLDGKRLEEGLALLETLQALVDESLD